MTLETIKTIESRHLHRPDASARRLSREQLEVSVPMDSEVTSRLPKIAAETLGIGYGFDQLVIVDLKKGGIHKMPSRYDITRATAASDEAAGSAATASRQTAFYRGCKANSRIAPEASGLFTTNSSMNRKRNRQFMTKNTTGSGSSAETLTGSWTTSANSGFMMAYAGNGTATKGQVKGNYDHYIVGPVSEEGKDVIINIPAILSLLDPVTDDSMTGEAAQGLDYLYSYLTPSAWEAIEVNQQVIADFSLTVKDLHNTLDAIYNRGRNHLGVRLGDPTLMKMVISLIELGAAVRSKRFSPNIFSNNGLLADTGTQRVQYIGMDAGDTEKDWDEGVVNDFFTVIQNRYLVCPWWLVNQLNFYDFNEDEREHEMRDIDRKDAIETLHYIFQQMDVEKGLLHGSDSTLPMLVFDKFKEGVLKSFKPSEYTSIESTLAANLLGFRTPRDADHGIQSTTAGNVGYFAQLPNAHGMLLGSEKAEFLDRIAEAGEHTLIVTNPEGFKDGMQLTASFSYQALLGRTNTGEAHLDYRVYPGGWYRGVSRTVTYHNGFASSGFSPAKDIQVLNILFFPLLGWSQFYSGASTRGFLPAGLNGAAYTERLGADPRVFKANAATGQHLWPTSDAGENYWQPGRDNYSAMLLKGTNDLYRTWMDRSDTIATEGVVVPSMGTLNLVAEMSYDTPSALVTRNFPHLRKLYQIASINPTITNTDTAYDFLSAGDDCFGISAWRGSTPWKLVDRHLDDETLHPRDGELDLMPFVHVSGVLPESWTDVFQLRDWLMFYTSLQSEPIMDSYTRTVQDNTFRNSGYINSRLVIYVDETESDGRVQDMTGTPMVGSFLIASEGTAARTFDTSTEPPLLELFPDTGEECDYEMYLLDMTRVRSERTVNGVRVTNAIHMSSNLPNDLTEADFIPGRGHALRWVREAGHAQTQALGWSELFGDTSAFPTASTTLAFFNNIDYDVATAIDAFVGGDSEITLAGGVIANPSLGHGSSKVLTNRGLIHWTQMMGRMITSAREGLEYSRAQPFFTIFDKDITDITESKIRQVLAPRMLSTVGPLTFVGTMMASGEQESSVTITGDTRRELISLTSGAGSSADDGAEPDPEEDSAGDENPSLAIAEKPAVE